MPNKLYAIQYNGRECLLHLKYDEQKMTVNLLSDEMVRDLQVSSFEVNSKGELMTPAIAKTDMLSLDAVKELYTTLMAMDSSRSIRKFDERASAA